MIFINKHSSKFWFFSVFLFVAIVASVSCIRDSSFVVGKKVLCDAELLNEKGDKFITSDDSSILFKGGNIQSELESHSGKYSVMTIAGKSAFAFSSNIENIGPDAYFRISAWRKSKTGNGVLVATAKEAGEFYLVAKKAVELDSNGWEKLEMDVYTPPNYGNQKLIVYVWNNGNKNDTVFFDDLVIERKQSKEFPNYNYKQGLNLILDTNDIIKINKKRERAFSDGILQTDDNDWIKGIIIDNDIAKKTKMRLKGDWLDHLWGNKWSYRVKMRKDNVFNRMRVFSLQTPAARAFLNEWLVHQLFHYNDILTTRYGFIPLSIVDDPRGLYAWEEHMAKQLLEWNNRREGPIVKFSEDAFWQFQKIYFYNKKWPSLPYYQSSVVVPFGENRTLKNPALFNQFLNADILMNQYKLSTKKPAQIFDIDKLAAYYAMIDLSHARHGQAWHNQRLYYNPVICKLEPIAYDAYTEDLDLHLDFSINDNIAYKTYAVNKPVKNFENLVYRLFSDSLFVVTYLDYLEEYSQKEFVNSFLNSKAGEIQYLDSLLRLEFPYYYFDIDFMRKSAAEIRNFLPQLKNIVVDNNYGKDVQRKDIQEKYNDSSVFENTPEYFVNVYVDKHKNDSLLLDVRNFFPGTIAIIGTGYDSRFVTSYFTEKVPVKAYQNGFDGVRKVIVADTSANFLFFYIKGCESMFSVRVLHWPCPSGETPQQKLMQLVDMDNPIFERVYDNQIDICKGEIVIDKPIIIPKGYVVNIYPGTKIDVVNNSMILSYSPVNILGTEDNPVEITSSDYSANGIAVLQAKGKSTMRNVRFKNMNTLNYENWSLTGAVTFYESDVVIENALFYRNQCEDALNIVRSEFELRNSTFEYTFSDAFDADFSNGIVDGCNFENIGNDAMDFSGSNISILNTSVNIASDKGVSGGEDSYVNVDNVIVNRCNIGFASKDLSRVIVSNSKVSECNYGIVLLRKKPEYGPSFMKLTNTEFFDLKVVDLIEKNSYAIINNDTIIGLQENLSELFY